MEFVLALKGLLSALVSALLIAVIGTGVSWMVFTMTADAPALFFIFTILLIACTFALNMAGEEE